MRKAIRITTREMLESVTLPDQTDTYTVISHGLIINTIIDLLEKNNFVIIGQLYRSAREGNIAQGTYILNYSLDPELNLMISFVNSYDKSLRFRLATGAKLNTNNGFLIGKNDAHYSRIHKGTADKDAIDQIQKQISDCKVYYERLVEDKNKMLNTNISLTKFSEFVGKMYIDCNLLTSEQVSIIKQEIKKPSYDYQIDLETLWGYYQHIIVALKKAHPRNWINQQILIHEHLISYFGVRNFDSDETEVSSFSEDSDTTKNAELIVDSNQSTSLFDSSAINTQAEKSENNIDNSNEKDKEIIEKETGSSLYENENDLEEYKKFDDEEGEPLLLTREIPNKTNNMKLGTEEKDVLTELVEDEKKEDERIAFVIKNEILELYGTSISFSYKIEYGNYVIDLETGESFLLPADYVEERKKTF